MAKKKKMNIKIKASPSIIIYGKIALGVVDYLIWNIYESSMTYTRTPLKQRKR